MSAVPNEVVDLPDEVTSKIGISQYPETATFDAEDSYAYNTLAATQNGNPLYWDDDVAAELTDGRILPPTTLSLWMRPHYWEPGAEGEQVALKVHFDLKALFDLPEAVMTDNTIIFHEPVRAGDRISNSQILRSVSGPKTTKLGSGRFWVIDVEFRNQRDEVVGVESYTGFGYRRAESGAAS
ncbi:MAG: MaoC family dehydratase N-terminal domain-containing protein [Actinomycetota bacterium]|nr:MaoC family dehydratase N-terminal domain-containing protein [Actinomycetota bacterium]